jgi:hypothetical protein
VVTADKQIVTFAPTATAETGRLCPICQVALKEGELSLTCPSCHQIHHRECWAEVGGCSTYGCPQAPAVLKPDEGQQRMLTAWGDTKTCPVCGETIKSIALRCRYCGTDFETVDPQSLKDLRKRAKRQDDMEGLRKSVWALFICSLVPCIAPLMLIIDLAWFLPKRKQIAKAGPLFMVLGYIALTATSVYTLLIVLFAVFGRSG